MGQDSDAVVGALAEPKHPAASVAIYAAICVLMQAPEDIGPIWFRK
jgi:hypothetical protein